MAKARQPRTNAPKFNIRPLQDSASEVADSAVKASDREKVEKDLIEFESMTKPAVSNRSQQNKTNEIITTKGDTDSVTNPVQGSIPPALDEVVQGSKSKLSPVDLDKPSVDNSTSIPEEIEDNVDVNFGEEEDYYDRKNLDDSLNYSHLDNDDDEEGNDDDVEALNLDGLR